MENRGKKFIIPELEEIDEITEKSTAPSYFQAGKLTDKENDSKNDDSHKMNPTSASTGTNQNARASESDCFKMSDPNPTTAVTNLNCNLLHTKFESAFSNLRSSKFYESCEHADDPSVTNKKKTEFFSKGTGSILVNPRQRGNPLLLSIRNVPWEFEEIEPDYIIGKTACVLFLSMRYHNLFPNYIHERLKSLGKSYNLRVLLVQVDVLEPSHPLKDLSVIAILADCTLMVAWSPEEAGSYLETYKIFENKSADLIKEKQGDDNYSQLIDCLTTVRSINKTDAMVLLSTFGTLEKIMKASVSHLSMCPGMGPLKAKRLYDAFRKPFKNEKKDGKQKA